jgi:hypothetical protein
MAEAAVSSMTAPRTPAEAAGTPPHGPTRNVRDDSTLAYRPLSQYAIASAVLAIASPLACFDWWLAIIPGCGLALGLVGWLQTASRPDTLAGRPLAIGGAAFSLCCLVGSLTWLSIVYAAELPPGYERIGYDILQPLPGDPPDSVPDSARAADGRDVLLKGYMYPGKQQRGIVEFLLVRDQGDCCFGGNPKLTDRVLVRLADRQGIDFTPRLVKIAGRFTVRPGGAESLDGGVLYHLDQAFTR